MKVLFITPRFHSRAGGDGLYAFHLAKGLVSQGISVSILTIHNDEFVVLTLRQSNEDEKEIRHVGKVGKSQFNQNYYSRSAAKAVERAVQLILPDVIHIHGLHQYFTLSTALYLKTLDIPVVLTVHDYKIICGNAGFFSDRTQDVCMKCITGKSAPPMMERCKKNSSLLSAAASAQMLMWNIWEGLDAIDCFHCGSEFVYQLLANNPWTREKRTKIRFPYLEIVPSSRDVHDDSLRLVYSGRMVPHKGPIIFARAIEGIDDIPIHVFGDGYLFEEIQKLIKKKNNVTLYGWKTHEEIHKQLGPGSVVVVPYLP